MHMKVSRIIAGFAVLLSGFTACDLTEPSDPSVPAQLFQLDLQNGEAGYEGCEDTWIRSDYPIRNYGSMTTLLAGYSGPERNIHNRMLIKFNLNEVAIPTGAVIQKAFLYLYNYTDDDDGETADFRAYAVLKAWSAGFENGSDNSLYATWNNSAAGDTWATPGGDYSDAPASSVFINTPDADGFGCLALSPPLVRAWLANPAENYGILIKQINEDVRSVPYFVSSDGIDNNDLRPKLSILYSLD